MPTSSDTPLRTLVNKVPEITLTFWAIKILATTVRPTAGWAWAPPTPAWCWWARSCCGWGFWRSPTSRRGKNRQPETRPMRTAEPPDDGPFFFMRPRRPAKLTGSQCVRYVKLAML